MRRHPALAPLSQEHQHELAHARRLLRAAGAEPEERLAAAKAYIDAFFAETVEHFRREEEILFPLYLRHGGSTPTLERILRDHMQLHGLVRTLRASKAAGDIRPEALRTLGDLLYDHVRIEERELFAEIERIVPAAELEAVGLWELVSLLEAREHAHQKRTRRHIAMRHARTAEWSWPSYAGWCVPVFPLPHEPAVL